jgi:6-pyruvoyltetrahydropterin/6-carboxytetrahydropterin synthase
VRYAMVLTANRRFTFCASRRLARDRWTSEESERVYGAGREGAWGSGENYQVHLVFGGDVDPTTGFLVNLTEVKEAMGPLIDTRYDHRFLNLDTPPFGELPPTAENLAATLLGEAQAACRGLSARPVACHLLESPDVGATAYVTGRVEREVWIGFSAARRTYSPHLSDEENRALFGRACAPAGHGHGYRLRVVLGGPVDAGTGVIAPRGCVAATLGTLHEKLDHRNLNLEVPELAGEAVTTECLARLAYRMLRAELPVARVRLHETRELFAEYDGAAAALSLERGFSAAHCLRRPELLETENTRLFGRCANPNGHGHRYAAEATVGGELDDRSGTVIGLPVLEERLAAVLDPWDGKHLDREVEEFRALPSTGENILTLLWPRLDGLLDGRLVRLRLIETENNRFAARRRAEG